MNQRGTHWRAEMSAEQVASDQTQTDQAQSDQAESATEAAQTAESLAEVSEASTNLLDAVASGDLGRAGEAAQGLLVAAVPVATNIAVGVVILIAAVILSKRARSLVTAVSRRSRVDVTLSTFFGQVARWAVLILGIIVAVGKIGIPTASFVAIIGGASLAVGLAFQGSLGNLAAGVMLLIFCPFKIGDVVQVGGVTATVAEIDLFTTLLDTFDNRRVTMPNGNIFGNEIENLTYHPTRRVDVTVGTSYDADVDSVRQVLEGVARGVRGGLASPEPQVYLTDFGASSIDWAVRVWSSTADYWKVRERLVRDLKAALDRAGVGIPYPQMDIHLHRGAGAARTP
jgi:small conductance mechanosensitive channel